MRESQVGLDVWSFFTLLDSSCQCFVEVLCLHVCVRVCVSVFIFSYVVFVCEDPVIMVSNNEMKNVLYFCIFWKVFLEGMLLILCLVNFKITISFALLVIDLFIFSVSLEEVSISFVFLGIFPFCVSYLNFLFTVVHSIPL